MGACFVTMSVPASCTRDEVKQQFERAQDDDRYENGHSYSGGFGMATGLAFMDETFPDVQAAEQWLDRHCVKWEDALAVKHKTLSGGEMWLIGAMCAS